MVTARALGVGGQCAAATVRSAAARCVPRRAERRDRRHGWQFGLRGAVVACAVRIVPVGASDHSCWRAASSASTVRLAVLVFDDQPVDDADDAVGIAGDLGVVRHQDDRDAPRR